MRILSPARFATVGLVSATVSLSGLVEAQTNRPQMTINEEGEVLRWVQETSNDPTLILESDGTTTPLIGVDGTFGATVTTVGGFDVEGFGNLADLNDQGIAVMKVAADDPARGDDNDNQYLVTDSASGSPSVIAVARPGGTGSTVFGDWILCRIGPMPEINNSGEIAWFGSLAPAGEEPDDCEDVDSFVNLNVNGSSFNQSWTDDNSPSSSYFVFDELVGGTGSETEADLIVDDDVTGSYFLRDTDAELANRTAVFRYSPGTGSEALVEASLLGTADSISVSDSRFVDDPTTFYLLEVAYIRDGERMLNERGDMLAYAFVSDVQPDTLVNTAIENCTATVSSTSDNPDDDPADDMPFVQYGSIDCPGADQLPDDEEEALLLLRDGTVTVVAMTGPDSDYYELEQHGAGVLNARGQVLYKAVRNVEPEVRADRSHTDLEVLELFTPGFGVTVSFREDDPIGTAESDFCWEEFSPYNDLADDGSFAFHAQIGDCPDSGRGDEVRANDGETGIFYWDAGENELIEIMRTSDVADDDPGPGPFNYMLGDIEITEIGAVAINPVSGLVMFYAESDEEVPSACDEGKGTIDDNEWTAILSWTPQSGVESVIEEGTLLGTDEDDVIHRIYTAGPKFLRAQANSSAQAVALLDIDRDGDCDVDDDDQNDPDGEEAIVIGRGTPPPGALLEIPVLGPIGAVLFAGALLMLSLMWVRSQSALG